MDVAPALAFADGPAAAWSVLDAWGRRRVVAAVPAAGREQRLGPTSAGGHAAGSDGAPALVATAAGDLLVVASRSTRRGSYLWTQRHVAAGWLEPTTLPTNYRDNHHPAAASGGGHTWMVWIAGDGLDAGATLVAAQWGEGAWGIGEPLPRAPGAPMTPAIAVAEDGTVFVVWSASDGADAEVWISRRGASGWSEPLALSNNGVPDLMPSVAAGPAGAWAAWSTFTPSGYVPVVAGTRRAGSTWTRPKPLSGEPGTSPRILLQDDVPAVVWNALPADARVPGTRLRISTVASGRWSRPEEIAFVPAAQIAVASDGRGKVAVAWPESGDLAVAEGTARTLPRHRGSTALRSLRGPAPRSDAPRLPRVPQPFAPGRYEAFGDSITEGLVRIDETIYDTPGYPQPLGEHIGRLLGHTVEVVNSGFGGEFTAVGVGRLQSIISQRGSADVTFLMEGTNDAFARIDAGIIVFHLQTMIDSLLETDSLPVVSSIIPFNELDFGGSSNELANEINALLAPVVESTGAVWVDQHAAFLYRPDLYSESIHPNEEGYAYMAGVWFEGIRPILTYLLEQQDQERSSLAEITRQRGRELAGHR